MWCGGFPPWPSENRHETHVTTKSQRSGFLKRDTRQTWQCSFPLGPWDSLGTGSCRAWRPPGSVRRGRRWATPAPRPRARLRLLAPWPFFPSFLRGKSPEAAGWGVSSFVLFPLPRREEEGGRLTEARPHARSWASLPPTPSAGGHVPVPGWGRPCRLLAVPVFRARRMISQGSPEGQKVWRRGCPATTTCPTCSAASAKVRAQLPLSRFIRGLSDSPRLPLTVYLTDGRYRLRLLVTSW